MSAALHSSTASRRLSGGALVTLTVALVSLAAQREALAQCCTLTGKRVTPVVAELTLTLNKVCYSGNLPAAGDVTVIKDTKPVTLRWALNDQPGTATYTATDGSAPDAHIYEVTAGRTGTCNATFSLPRPLPVDARPSRPKEAGPDAEVEEEEEGGGGCGCGVGLAALKRSAAPLALLLLPLLWVVRRRR